MEKIESINQHLIDEYGIDTVTGQPMFRIVFSDDQTEMRLVDTLDSGIRLLYAQVMEVKKYSYLKGIWVLERLVVIPDINQRELPASKLSYEPLWAYRDAANNPLPPIWEATKYIVDALYAALGKKSLRNYVEEEDAEERIFHLQEELFGNETETGDALAYGEAIVVPGMPEKES